MKKIDLLIILTFIFLISCGDVGKVLRNEKIRSTDEFLIKKKDPLILPPDFEEIPSPDSIADINKKSENKLKKILENSKDIKKNNSKSSSVEESILKRIPK